MKWYKSTPVQFLGNLLGLFGLKMKSRKDSEGKRWYRLDEEVINDPTRQQVLACIESKLSQPKEEIDWEAAINEAHGVSTENQAQTQAEQGLKGTAPSPQILYTNQVEGAVNNLESQGVDRQVQKADSRTDLERLINALEAVGSLEEFSEVAGGCELGIVEDAIASSGPDQPRRCQLSQWLIELNRQFDDCLILPSSRRLCLKDAG